MKCTRCKGKGKFIGYYVNDNPVECECVICKGAGEVQMTEQEYIQTCNTEQLAEWLAKQKCDGCNDEPYDDKHGTCKYCMTKKMEQIREWLKQPHNSPK